MMISLTISAEQRYRNAVTKARRIARRNLGDFLAGKRQDSGTPGLELERQAIVAEIQRLQDEVARLTGEVSR